MVKNRNSRSKSEDKTDKNEPRPSNDQLWGRVDKHAFCNKPTEAFPILVRLAKRGSAKAQFLAGAIELIYPGLTRTEEGIVLANLQIKSNPFKNIKDDHPIYRLLSIKPEGIVRRAIKKPTPFIVIVAALHCCAKPSDIRTYGTALDLMLLASANENLTAVPYFKKLIVDSTISLLDSIKRYKPKNDPTSVEFKDGSTCPMTTVSKALVELERLCARPLPTQG